jgi:ATP-binding cassette, subfamily B, bacterial
MQAQEHRQSEHQELLTLRQHTRPHIVRRRRVPQIAQMNMVECGAACLAMILSYYGCQTNVSEIRERCGIGRDGLSALSLARVARDYGMRVRSVSLQKNDLRFVRLPAIVYWEFDHFIVVERWSPKYVDVVNPATGRMRITAEEFDVGFTGVVIQLEPGTHFMRHDYHPQLSLRTYIASCFKQAPWTFLQVMGASLLLQLFGLALPLLTKVVVDRVVPAHTVSVLSLLGIGLLVMLLAQLVTMSLRGTLLVYLQARVDLHMMFDFFEHLLTLPLRFFQQRSSGDLLARLGSNAVIRDLLSNQLVSTVLDSGFVIVYLIILFWQSYLFGLCVLGIGLLQICLLLCTKRPLQELTMRELVAQGKAQGYENEILTGIISLKAAGVEQRAFQHWSNLFCEQLNISVRRNLFSTLIDTAMVVFQTFSPLILLWIGVIQVLSGAMPIGTMLALNALAIAFLTPLSSLVSSGRSIQLAQAHLERLADVMEAEPEQQPGQVRQPGQLKGNITLKNISFRYSPHTPDTLKNITVDIAAGQRVAIVGRTGSGKSTLGKLLLGLHLPTQGELCYDGIPLHLLNYQSVRSQFGVVMQDATVFSGTVRENIAFNDPTIDLDSVVRAAQIAELHDDIMSMPMGYDTYIAEQGSMLSGGQRQRLMLARAIVHYPVLLLLDEATSALDTTTESRVEQNLRSLACTQVIIAHRLSTIRNADIILVLDDGKIVERGTHQELLRLGGYYTQLVQSQSTS